MKIVAHRGIAPGFKELTPAAFEHSLALPIHGVECDVRLCRTGEVVLHHDRRLGRTSSGFSKVSSLSLDQLRQQNFGTEDAPQTILTLDEMLGMIKDAGDKHLYLEIKHPSRYGRMLEEQVQRALIYAGMLEDERIHIISFSTLSIRRMAELAPALDRIYLRRQWELRYNPGDVQLCEPTALGLGLSSARVRPDLVGAHGLPSYMWTLNSAADIRFAERVGTDVIATDFPELALETLGQLASVD